MSDEGTYLISGGLGALGLHTARRLVERGARHLVLLGRHGLPERTASSESWKLDETMRQRIMAVQALEGDGAEVRVLAVDVADKQALAATLRGLHDLPPFTVMIVP